MTFGERVLSLRTEKGMTQDELALAVGYKSRSTIAKIESGERDPHQSMITAIAKALETTPAYLMGWEEWDKEAADLKKQLSDDTEWLKKYLNERFSNEDVSMAYELIIQLPKFNKDGLIKILERMDELSELKKYLNIQ